LVAHPVATMSSVADTRTPVRETCLIRLSPLKQVEKLGNPLRPRQFARSVPRRVGSVRPEWADIGARAGIEAVIEM
jgi:hypothetical protein